MLTVCLAGWMGADSALAQYPDRAGYVSLFNGRDLSGWKMQWEGLWNVERGVLTGRQDPAKGGDSWLFTENTWDDFILQLEFKMTSNCNSGVGIRMPKSAEGRPSQYGYEVQISDVDEEFPTGSLFRHLAANIKMQGPNWNEMHIACVKDHIVVYVNKQKVLDARNMTNSLEGRIGLQVHGGAALKDQVVQFRNIRIKDLKPQYRCLQSPLQFKTHQIDSLLSEGCTVTDINRDGRLDITCGPRWYQAPDWTPHELREVIVSGEYMNNYGEIALDVNRDGWMDVISGGWFIPKMAWYENPGNPESAALWKEHVIANDLDGTEVIYPCDIDKDGRTDVLANFYNMDLPATYFAYVGLDKSESGFERRVLGDQGRGHGMGFGDLNGDGRSDVLTPSGWYESPLHPKSEQWSFHRNFRAEHTGIPFLVDDFNEDGLADIVFGYAHDYGLYWLEQTKDSAGRRQFIEHPIDETYSQLHCPILVDLDGDGTKDIVAGKRYRGHNGADPGAMEPQCIFWYRVKKGPDPQFTKHIVSYDENIGMGMNTHAVDIDYDGDLDLVAPGKTGLYLLENVTGQ
ncbi:MAG: family 16 glycoside hydrolase [Candidatus Omnitrophota bacterium]